MKILKNLLIAFGTLFLTLDVTFHMILGCARNLIIFGNFEYASYLVDEYFKCVHSLWCED